ncbi:MULTISPECIES: hypothetical protein [unclassified Microcoleus]|uniref:hypothetical protein n=1 Tax=unclassified Microcoleus TaxID=2642155 RepID=UPI002FD36BAD
MTDKIISPPGSVLNDNISWNNDNGGACVFPKIQVKDQFTVDVGDSSQVSCWESVFSSPQVLDNGEHEVCEKVLNPQVLDNGDPPKVTIAIIRAAVKIAPLLTLASLIAYGLSRGYSVTGKKTGTTMQFEFKPKRQVSYKVSGVYTSSSLNLNDEDDLSLDAILTDKDGHKLGTFQIIREPE